MTRFRFQALALAPALCACLALSARAQLAQNQTNAFGNNNLLTFTYLENFDCVDQPLLDHVASRVKNSKQFLTEVE